MQFEMWIKWRNGREKRHAELLVGAVHLLVHAAGDLAQALKRGMAFFTKD